MKMKFHMYFEYILVAITFLVIAVLHLKTMLPGQGFHDVGELQTMVATLNVPHPTGFPVYILLGRLLITLLPFEPALSVNFLSFIYSFVALFFLWLVGKKLTRNIIVALTGMATLGVSEPFWNYAGMADTHTLSRAFLMILIYLQLRLSRWSRKLFLVFCLIIGLALGGHLLVVYALPGLFLWFLGQNYDSWKPRINTYLAGALFVAIGLLSYLLLPLREPLIGPVLSVDYSLTGIDGIRRHVLGEDFQGLMFEGTLWEIANNALKGFYYLLDTFGIIAIVVGALGIASLFKKNALACVSLGVMFILLVLFSTNYPTSDPSRYYLWFMMIFAIYISVGFGALAEGTRRFPYSSVLMAIILLINFYLVPMPLIYKNYQKVNKTNDTYAAHYSSQIMAQVPGNAVIISWWNYSTPLWYRQEVLGEREDVLIMNLSHGHWINAAEQYIGSRPVYIVEENQNVQERFNATREGLLYRLSR